MFMFYNMAPFAYDEAASDAEFRSKHLNPDRVARKLKNTMIRQYQAVADNEETKDLKEDYNLKKLAEAYYRGSYHWANEEDRKARGKENKARKQLEHDADLFPDIAERETYRRNKDDLDAVYRDSSALQDENDQLRLKARQIKAHVQTAMRIKKEFPNVVYNPEWNSDERMRT
jgi:hypothetical protein